MSRSRRVIIFWIEALSRPESRAILAIFPFVYRKTRGRNSFEKPSSASVLASLYRTCEKDAGFEGWE